MDVRTVHRSQGCADSTQIYLHLVTCGGAAVISPLNDLFAGGGPHRDHPGSAHAHGWFGSRDVSFALPCGTCPVGLRARSSSVHAPLSFSTPLEAPANERQPAGHDWE